MTASVRYPEIDRGAPQVGVDEAVLAHRYIRGLLVVPKPGHDQAVKVEGLPGPDLAEGRVFVVGEHLKVRVHLDRDRARVADEPLDVQRLAHRAPDPPVVLLDRIDAVEFEGAVEHAHIRRHVVVEGAGVLMVEPADIGVEVLAFHGAPLSGRAAAVTPAPAEPPAWWP